MRNKRRRHASGRKLKIERSGFIQGTGFIRKRRTAGKRKWFLIGGAALLVLLLAGGALVTWFSYKGRVYTKCVFEAGVEVRAEDFLKNKKKEIRFADDSKPVDTHVPGEYPVKLKSGFFTYNCTAVIQDTIPPTAETVTVYYEEGQEVGPESFVTNIQDETEVTVTYMKEPDLSYFGVQQVEIVLTDAGGNRIQISSQMISRMAAAELTLEAGENFPGLQAFLEKEAKEVSFLTDISTIDTKKPGDYTIEILANGITYTTLLHIQDTVAPVVEVQNLTIYNSERVACEDFVTKAVDATALTYAFETEPDMTRLGEQPLILIVTDGGGNTVKKELLLTVLEDTVAPVIKGATYIKAYLGIPVQYKENVTVTDDHDKNVQLEVDTSSVNIQTLGKYPVRYIATDGAGNQTILEVTVEIIERVVSEAEMYRMADELLAEITSADMTQWQKMHAIYYWTRNSIEYVGSSDKSDWISAACEGFALRRGDCYTYACAAKVLLTRAGIENKDIGTGNGLHYWNLVNIGEGWYHFDATPRPDQDLDLCYITDAQLMAFGETHRSTLNRYDRSVYTDIQ